MQFGKQKQINQALFLVALSLCIGASSLAPAIAQNATTTTAAPLTALQKAGPTSIKSPEDLIDWMTYYYMHPQPELLTQALTYADTSGLVDKGQAPLTAFCSQVFAQNPKRIQQWTTELSGLSSRSKPMVWSALWWSSTLEGRQALDGLLQALPQREQEAVVTQMAKPAQKIEELEINKPEVLDELWGAFSATGDEKYINRLMTALPWMYGTDGDFNRMTLGSAAKWSLASNAQQHPRVMKIVLKARDTQPNLKRILDSVVAEATKTAPPAQAGKGSGAALQ